MTIRTQMTHMLFVSLSIRSPEASPAERVLQAMATGGAVDDVLRSTLSSCARRLGEPGECGRSFLRVVNEVSKTDLKRRDAVLAALDANQSRQLPEAAAEETKRFMKAVSSGERTSVAAPESWRSVGGDEGPPSHGDDAKLPTPVFRARLMRYLEEFLPTDSSQRLHDAFVAGTAEDCTTAYSGSVTKVCEDLGLWPLQWASLWLGVIDIRDSEGRGEVVNAYLAMDRLTLKAAIEKGEVSTDEGLGARMRLLRRWIERPPPNQWSAWLDIEQVLGP